MRRVDRLTHAAGTRRFFVLNYRSSALVRFIGRRRALSTETAGHVDESGFVDGRLGLVKHAFGCDVPRGAPFFARGWAIDLGRKRLPWELRVELDGRENPSHVIADVVRPDIARRFHSPALLTSGFIAIVGTRKLAVGPHALRIRAIVGRYGSAFAPLSGSIGFFIHSNFAKAVGPPAEMPVASDVNLESVPTVVAGGILTLEGSATDERSRPFGSVSAQIDDGAWAEGWCAGSAGDFIVRVRLDTIAAGAHRVRLAGKGRRGTWVQLGPARSLTVGNAERLLSPWAQPLLESGRAVITDAQGAPLTALALYRLRAGITLEGRLTRSSPIGAPVALFARTADGAERSLPCWSAPTADPGKVRFGAEIPERALPPGSYRLWVKAPDRSHRFIGSADTGCDLVVERRPPSVNT